MAPVIAALSLLVVAWAGLLFIVFSHGHTSQSFSCPSGYTMTEQYKGDSLILNCHYNG